ncbi:hypothetical protein BDFB_012910 [Asbolus verrucosus]|uniref:Uncharacterized protein n=1 Tax=Asbolus verrucosus TaxID=1661398 RepID=A0A482VJG8_ASBVE|nr:hypothetical protein BDFB_012910 [Asbolus verrucosus]
MLDRNSRSMKLSKLYPGTRYLICVLALGNWASHRRETAESRLATRKPENGTGRDALEIFNDAMLPLLVDSPTSKCAEVSTLGAPDSMHVGLGSLPDHGLGVQSILTRRLGLIIGCCMGFVVFIVLVSVLGYLKLKKQRAAVKRDQPIPPEYISYRHFSIQSGEAGAHGGHPHFITNMNTTSLN